MGKKSFVMYDSWDPAISAMSDEQAGKLLKAIYAYRKDPETKPEDGAVSVIFALIREKLKEDSDAYDETCAQRAEAGRKGGQKKAENVANGSKSKQKVANGSKTKQNVPDTDKDTEYDIENEYDTEYEKENNPPAPLKRGSTRMRRPAREEVADYCSHQGYEIDVDAFMDFYSSKGWMVGKSPMKDWKAAVRNWARRDRNEGRASPDDYLLSVIRGGAP